MTVRLRAHHMLCLLTFAGEGYTPAFVDNLCALAARVGAGEPVELVDGPDDVCAPLAVTEDRHCDGAPSGRRDRQALLALAETGLIAGSGPHVFDAPRVAAMRAQFRAGTIRAACRGCEWSDLCGDLAARDYAGTALWPDAFSRPRDG